MHAARRTAALLLALVVAAASARADDARPRARDLGIHPGVFEPGPLNAITDVPGVRVGQTTIVEGQDVRTGVTAILPHAGNLYEEKVAGAVHVFNAFGKLVGATQVRELGQIETPVLLTNTLSVWDVAAATADWMLAQPGNETVRSINPLVGETNDGRLNDIRGRYVKAEHVRRALESASAGLPDEGSVGAGAGTIAFGWKGGIGTSSRRLPREQGSSMLGVLVQSNFGGHLTIDGVPVWRSLRPRQGSEAPGGSCMIVVATDAALDARQLERLAARAIHGMARVGGAAGNGSGDYAIAFSTTTRSVGGGPAAPVAGQRTLAEDELSPFFEGVIEVTEEALLNSLLKATTVSGKGGRVAEAIPIGPLQKLLRPPVP